MSTVSRKFAQWLNGAVDSGLGVRGRGPLSRPAERPRPSAAVPPDAQVSAELALDGEEVALVSEEIALGPQAADPEVRLPEGFAVLKVHRERMSLSGGERRQAFAVEGFGDDIRLPYTLTDRQLRAPDLSLGNVQPGDGDFPTLVYRTIKQWSARQPGLVAWINRLRLRHGEELNLVIWDDTDYDIPWELLWLDGGLPEQGLAPGHLGAVVTVARWTTIHEVGTPPLARAEECAGHVLCYFHEHMDADVGAFSGFSHRPHRELLPFLGELERAELRAGLVYLACHGTYGQQLRDLMLGHARWVEMNDVDMAALRHHATLVCLNACHTARVVHNTSGGEDALRGFAELFLRKGARGCIASSGQVGDDVAHGVIHEIVGDLAADPAKPVARALREYRARAAAALPDAPAWVDRRDDDTDVAGQWQILPALYSFMFLYFGPPLTTLRLTPGDQDGDS